MAHPRASSTANPTVSVIMAHHNAAPYIGEAIDAILCQSLGALELILSDDGSTDGSAAIAREAADRDQRVRLLRSDRCAGPATARNRALDVARGDWIAIVDADDLVHPARLERLVNRATALGADIIADDLIYFGAESGRTLLGSAAVDRPWFVGAREFLAAETRPPVLPVGYLKPLIRRPTLGAIRYREYLTIGEDFDLLFRVLLGGAKLAILPQAYYLYRRHSASTSHRMSGADLACMLRSIGDVRAELPEASEALDDLLEMRRTTWERAARFAELVRLLKDRDKGASVRLVARNPDLILPLARAAQEHVSRTVRPGRRVDATRHLCLVPEAEDFRAPPPFHRVTVPDNPADWTPARAAALVAEAGRGKLHVVAVGRAGLEALGYVPGWAAAEIVQPADGWTESELARIAALPWPVSRMATPLVAAVGGPPLTAG